MLCMIVLYVTVKVLVKTIATRLLLLAQTPKNRIAGKQKLEINFPIKIELLSVCGFSSVLVTMNKGYHCHMASFVENFSRLLHAAASCVIEKCFAFRFTSL